MMSLQGQAYANVRDVLAPLFCNGRSFSSLIDELCKHFKLDTPASGHDAAGGLEAGSESQSTCSEAEGNISDETDYRRIQARVSAQARCHRARASPPSAKPPFPTTTPDPSTSLSPATVDYADVDGKSANASISYRTRPAPGVRMATRDPFEAAAPPTRKTRSRSQQQQRQRRPRTGSSATPTLDASTAEPSPALASSRPKGASGAPRGKARPHHPVETESKAGGGAASNGCTGKGSSARGGDEGGNHDRSQPCEPTPEETPVGEGTGGGARRTGGFNSTKASISGDTLTVLSVTASGTGWSEVVSAALAARARAGCVFAEEVDADSPQGSDSVREVFWNKKSRTLKALEVRTRLIPASQKVLLCSAWVDSGEYLEAAARLVALCQAEVYGIACVRFEQNPSTQGLWDRFNLFAKSMPRGTVPSLNTGVRKRGLGATLAKGLYPVYRGSGSPGAACANGGQSSGDGCGGTGVPAEVGANSAKEVNGVSSATRQVSSREKRIRGADVEHDADAVASCAPLLIEAAVTPATNPEPMDEGKGGLSCPTGVSAGEGLAQPGDGGEPAQRSTDGGESEGTYSDGGDGGSTRGRRQTHLISGATFGGEEGDYAADSELSTDYETMHINGGGGRESDDHDMSEREQIERSRRRHGLASMGAVSQPDTSSIVDVRAGDKGYDGDSSTRKRNARKVSSRERAAKSKRLRSGRSRSTERGRKSNDRDVRAVDDGGARGESGCREAPSASHSSGAKGEDKNSKRENSEASKSVGVGVGLASTGATLEWKAKLGRQPIFMSRGRAEKDPSLELGRTDERARGVSVGVSRSAQDPEDDRDRASSWSSADCPVPSATRGVPGGILRLDTRNGGSSGAGKMAGVTISHPVFATEGLDRGAESRPPGDTTGPDEAPPNSPGGVIPWYNTSVYEANDPTEDRHAELAHEALGVRIYCVCDGHGGSRAAQFVCDHLAADVLARVVAMAPAAPKRRSNESVATGSGDDIGSGKKYERAAWTGDEERVICSLREAFASCDQSFIAQLDPKKNRGYINAGCCVVLALFICSKLYVAHVGDCRVVLGTTDAARFPRDLLRPLSTPRNSGAAKVDSGSKAVGSPVATTAGAPAAGEVEAVALSRDHNCNDVDEIALVMGRSGDGNAIRVSKNDERKGARAIKRVAGSLAVTRAIGDAYLKEAVFSFSPYKEGVPYITAEPVVTSLELTSKDRFLILATDGVWEQVSNTEAVDCVSATLSLSSPATSAARGSPVSSPAKSRRQRSTAGRSPAGGKTGGRLTTSSDALVNYALERSAQGRGMSLTALKALPRGPLRRTLHDDMCATVVHFSPPPSGARGWAPPA